MGCALHNDTQDQSETFESASLASALFGASPLRLLEKRLFERLDWQLYTPHPGFVSRRRW